MNRTQESLLLEFNVFWSIIKFTNLQPTFKANCLCFICINISWVLLPIDSKCVFKTVTLNSIENIFYVCIVYCLFECIIRLGYNCQVVSCFFTFICLEHLSDISCDRGISIWNSIFLNLSRAIWPECRKS